MDNNTGYYCSVCKKAVIVIANEKPIKACNCNGHIIVDCSATVIKNGGGLKA